jgi:hypothetical protein
MNVQFATAPLVAAALGVRLCGDHKPIHVLSLN